MGAVRHGATIFIGTRSPTFSLLFFFSSLRTFTATPSSTLAPFPLPPVSPLFVVTNAISHVDAGHDNWRASRKNQTFIIDSYCVRAPWRSTVASQKWFEREHQSSYITVRQITARLEYRVYLSAISPIELLNTLPDHGEKREREKNKKNRCTSPFIRDWPW